MNFNKLYNYIIESSRILPTLDAEREVYAVYIVDSEEQTTGPLQAVGQDDDLLMCQKATNGFLTFELWDSLKKICKPMPFEEVVQKYYDYLVQYRFIHFNSEDILSSRKLASMAIDDLKQYSDIKGTWYFYECPYDCIVSLEVDMPYYRMQHILDAASEGVAEEDNILDW